MLVESAESLIALFGNTKLPEVKVIVLLNSKPAVEPLVKLSIANLKLPVPDCVPLLYGILPILAKPYPASVLN